MIRFAATLVLLQIIAQEPGALPGGIAARINGEIITWDEVELKLKGSEEERTAMRTAQLKRMAEDRLFLQEARKHGIVIPDSMVDESVKESKKKFKSDQEFDRYLAAVEGIGMSQFREQRRNMLLVNALIQRLIMDAFRNPTLNSRLLLEFVSPEEVRAYYKANPDEFKAHCEIAVVRLALQFAPADEAEKRKLMESLRRKAVEGSEMTVLAMYYMDAALMAGGLRPIYPSIKKEASPFEAETTKYVFHELKVGDVSRIVTDKNTLNVFQLQRKIDQKALTFEEAQSDIKRKLEHEKRTQNRKVLRDELIKRSFIEPADLFK